jgi:hypothetical protein
VSEVTVESKTFVVWDSKTEAEAMQVATDIIKNHQEYVLKSLLFKIRPSVLTFVLERR